TKLKLPLKIVGNGRGMKMLQAAAGSNVEFLGRVSDDALPGLLARAKGYIMPGEEDFGIAPVEANACGRPVIAFAAGGALDSQCDGVTGVLFPEQTVESLCEAVCAAESRDWDPEVIRAHALQFDTAVFQEKMAQVVAEARRNTVHYGKNAELLR
ncbi:MAG TPA: glycosyltransferase, partial [Chthonomonadaceae bacterium]|nr:glycosyltransferase [Chthonomonadaceae bacterium]